MSHIDAFCMSRTMEVFLTLFNFTLKKILLARCYLNFMNIYWDLNSFNNLFKITELIKCRLIFNFWLQNPPLETLHSDKIKYIKYNDLHKAIWKLLFIKLLMDNQWEFAVWLRKLIKRFCINLEGWDGEGNGKEVQKGGVICYLWLIHVEVWQKVTKFCKVIILQ